MFRKAWNLLPFFSRLLVSISFSFFDLVLFWSAFVLLSLGLTMFGLLLFDDVDVVCDWVLFLCVEVFPVVLEPSCLGCWIDVCLMGWEAKLLSYVWQATDVTDLTLLA